MNSRLRTALSLVPLAAGLLAVGVANAQELGAQERRPAAPPAPAVRPAQEAPPVDAAPAQGPAARRGATSRPEAQRPAPERPAAERPAAEGSPAAGSGPAPATRPAATAPKGHDLARVRSLFQAADTDRSGSVDSAEALRAGVSAREFTSFDADGSGAVSGDEFVVGFRTLAGAAGQPVADDLQAEATRIAALRRAMDAQRQRLSGGGPAAERIQAHRAGEARSDAQQQQTQQQRLENARQEEARQAGARDQRLENARQGAGETTRRAPAGPAAGRGSAPAGGRAGGVPPSRTAPRAAPRSGPAPTRGAAPVRGRG
jgi:hypothetical protein